MATGDIKNNLRKLMVELKQIRYPLTEVDLKGLAQGTPRSFLPILHYIFLDYSVDLTEFFAKYYELYGKTDLRFVETVYKLLRDVFHYKPPLTREQFLSLGYAERKIIELCDILKRCREKGAELNPKTTKTEKKHAQSKGKNKISETGKEIKSQPSNGLEKRVFSQPQNVKKKGNSNDILKKTTEQNKENTSAYPDGDKTKAFARDKGTFGQSSVKSVRWKEDESNTISLNEMKPFTQSTALTEINNSNARASAASTFTVMPTSMRVPPKTIPMPITMTTIPKPSPELMLTPVGKTRHQPIPLSGSGHAHEDVTNVSLIDLTDSTNVQQPTVVRHEYNHERESEALVSMPDQMSLITSQENDLTLLKSTVKELQEQLDSVLSQNNEMSARVVLLESRVKLLEEATTRNQCGNCMNTNYSLPNYNVSTNPFYTCVSAPASGVPRESGADSTTTALSQMMDQQEYVSHTTVSSSRSLMNEFTNSQNNPVFQNAEARSQRHPVHSSHMIGVPQASMVTELSDDDDDLGTSTVNTSSVNPKGSPLSCTPNKSTGTSLQAISPFSTTQEIHLKFSDPSTTATIINVERRLQETREMLANAARFAVTNLP